MAGGGASLRSTSGEMGGEAVTYTSWADGEPNNSGEVEHYATMGNWRSKTSGAYFVFGDRWNDMSGSGRFAKEQFAKPVCESS